MKRLILFELIILFLATTFESDSPPGWFQQVLPRTDVIFSDIFFFDSLKGWTTGRKNTNDTAFVFGTTNGGDNWVEQYRALAIFSEIQFLNVNTGYIAGDIGFGTVYKTTNSGLNWNLILNSGDGYQNLYFVNTDTGWISDSDPTFGAGLQKTTNGGVSWFQQLPRSFKPSKLFFINKDTGWVACNFSGIGTGSELYRTTNGGTNWSLQFTSAFTIEAIFFLTPIKGWMRGGPNINNVKSYTTDGGFNWISSQGYPGGGYDLKFVNDSIGFSGGSFNEIAKSTDGGKTWGYQNTPNSTNLSVAILPNESLKVWQARIGIIHTTDGGGPIVYTGIGINPNSGVIPSFNLKQNYPNPFNPSTNITFDVTKNSKISLKIFNMLGEEIDELIDYEPHNTGTYTINYETDDDIPSGVYFYQITAWTENKKEIFIDTKKMILLK